MFKHKIDINNPLLKFRNRDNIETGLRRYCGNIMDRYPKYNGPKFGFGHKRRKSIDCNNQERREILFLDYNNNIYKENVDEFGDYIKLNLENFPIVQTYIKSPDLILEQEDIFLIPIEPLVKYMNENSEYTSKYILKNLLEYNNIDKENAFIYIPSKNLLNESTETELRIIYNLCEQAVCISEETGINICRE